MADNVAVFGIGDVVRKLRKERDWTLDDLKEASSVNKTTLSEIESGQTDPRLSTLVRVANAFGAPLELLIASAELQKGIVPVRQGGTFQSPAEGEHGKIPGSRIGTEHAEGAVLQTRKAPHADARLREENAELRAALEVVAKAVVAFGAPETQKADPVAPRKPGRRRRTRKRA